MSSTTRIRPKVYTVTEFACLFAVSPRLVRDLIRKGEIPALKIGRSYRIPRQPRMNTSHVHYRRAPRSAPKPRVREADELTGFLFPVETCSNAAISRELHHQFLPGGHCLPTLIPSP